MPQSPGTNRRWVLAERPKGEPNENTLRLETAPVPEPKDGEVLLATEFLSLDPYMRGRMSDASSYAAPWRSASRWSAARWPGGQI